MNYFFGNNVPVVLLLSLVFLANAQRRDVDMHELERQNKITKQILEAYLQKKLGISSNTPRVPSILEILPVKMTAPIKREQEIVDDMDDADEEQENQDIIDSQELLDDQDFREDDNLQSVESEQIDSIYNTQGGDESNSRDLEDYLNSWGLGMYIDKFKEHSVDLDTLQILSSEDLKELVPVIGHRAKLTSQIAMLKDIVTDAFSDKNTAEVQTKYIY